MSTQQQETAPGETGQPDSPDEAAYDEHACKGACNTLWRKRGTGTPDEVEPGQYLCAKCARTLKNELAAIDTLAGMLAAADDGYRSSTGSDAAIRAHRGAAGRASPSPVTDMLSELESVLREWTGKKRPVAARLGLLARPVTESSSWLIANLFMYLSDETLAVPLYDDVRRWHSRLARQAKAGPALVSKPVPCPRCRERGLVQERGAEVVKCTSCGRMMGIREYEDLAAEAEDAAAAARVESNGTRKRAAG